MSYFLVHLLPPELRSPLPTRVSVPPLHHSDHSVLNLRVSPLYRPHSVMRSSPPPLTSVANTALNTTP